MAEVLERGDIFSLYRPRELCVLDSSIRAEAPALCDRERIRRLRANPRGGHDDGAGSPSPVTSWEAALNRMDAPRVVGVAGGVGTTTLATALLAHDGGREVEPSVDVLACRCSADSLHRAGQLLSGLSEAGWPRPVLAVTALAPGSGRGPLRARLRMIERQVDKLVILPYVAHWRDVSNPLPQAAGLLDMLPEELPRELRDYALAVVELVDAIVGADGAGSRGNGRQLARMLVAGTVAVSTPLAIASAAAAAPDGDWDQLAQCESSGKWNTNTGNGFAGGLQFTQSTWNAYGGKGSPAGASREEQIAVAERVLAGQGWGAWPACSRKLGLSSAPTPRSGTSPAAPAQPKPAQAKPAPATPAPAKPQVTTPAPAGSLPTRSAPTGRIPTGSIPTGSIPTGSIPTGSIPTGSIPTAPTKPKATTKPKPAMPPNATTRLPAPGEMAAAYTAQLSDSLSTIAGQLPIPGGLANYQLNLDARGSNVNYQLHVDAQGSNPNYKLNLDASGSGQGLQQINLG